MANQLIQEKSLFDRPMIITRESYPLNISFLGISELPEDFQKKLDSKFLLNPIFCPAMEDFSTSLHPNTDIAVFILSSRKGFPIETIIQSARSSAITLVVCEFAFYHKHCSQLKDFKRIIIQISPSAQKFLLTLNALFFRAYEKRIQKSQQENSFPKFIQKIGIPDLFKNKTIKRAVLIVSLVFLLIVLITTHSLNYYSTESDSFFNNLKEYTVNLLQKQAEELKIKKIPK